jgi:hypothetical protein
MLFIWFYSNGIYYYIDLLRSIQCEESLFYNILKIYLFIIFIMCSIDIIYSLIHKIYSLCKISFLIYVILNFAIAEVPGLIDVYRYNYSYLKYNRFNIFFD